MDPTLPPGRSGQDKPRGGGTRRRRCVGSSPREEDFPLLFPHLLQPSAACQSLMPRRGPRAPIPLWGDENCWKITAAHKYVPCLLRDILVLETICVLGTCQPLSLV